MAEAEKEMEGGVNLPGCGMRVDSLAGTGIAVADSRCPEVSGMYWIPDMPFPLIPSIRNAAKCSELGTRTE